jgi:Gpi18-like mannosyltransferase
MGCVLTGDWGNCISVNTTLFIQSLRITDLQQQVRAGDC